MRKRDFLSVAMGGHSRVGLEDSLWMEPKRTDERLVARIVVLGHDARGEAATSAEAREIIGLPPR